MMDQAGTSGETLREEIIDFRDSCEWAVLGTVGADGEPLASYAPCIADELGRFYVFLSGLSAHTHHLVETSRASLLVLEDKPGAGNPFARRRLTYRTIAVPIPRDAPSWEALLDHFAKRFGNIVETLRALGDFQLFRLAPESATYVRGFGQAYRLEGPELKNIEHVRPSGPPAAKPLTRVSSASEVLDFWYSEPVRPHWFRSSQSLDRQIRDRFLATYRAAFGDALSYWADRPEGALALTLVLDQFPLNMFRGQPEAFASEPLARRVAVEAVARQFDQHLSGDRKAFLYMPLMHSEALADQDRAVELYEQAGLAENLKWARHHRELIRRFGRFPHRNPILGREATPEEVAYLDSEDAFLG
jgi:uncharacterized protein (DUF924 family)